MSKPFYRWQPGEPFGLPPHRKEEHWNPIVGCDHGAMLGCLVRCWARQIVERFGDRWDVGSDFRPRLVNKWLRKPLSWREPRLVPTGFLGDIACLPRGDVGHVLDVIDATPRHRYLLLTKDPQRLAPALSHWSNYHGGMGIPFNAWLGATVRNQGDAGRVIPALLRAPAAHYWLSVEPILGSIDLTPWLAARYNPVQKGDRHGTLDASCGRASTQGGASRGLADHVMRGSVAGSQAGLGQVEAVRGTSSLQACPGGEGHREISNGEGDDRRQAPLCPSQSPDLVAHARPDSRNAYDQSQERRQERQPPVESGTGDVLTKHAACCPRPESREDSASGRGSESLGEAHGCRSAKHSCGEAGWHATLDLGEAVRGEFWDSIQSRQGQHVAIGFIVCACESGRGARWGSAICAAGQSGRCPLDNRMADDRDCRKCRRAEWKVVDWTRSLVAQCRDAGVPCMVKQCVAHLDGKWRVTSDPRHFPPDLVNE